MASLPRSPSSRNRSGARRNSVGLLVLADLRPRHRRAGDTACATRSLSTGRADSRPAQHLLSSPRIHTSDSDSQLGKRPSVQGICQTWTSKDPSRLAKGADHASTNRTSASNQAMRLLLFTTSARQRARLRQGQLQRGPERAEPGTRPPSQSAGNDRTPHSSPYRCSWSWSSARACSSTCSMAPVCTRQNHGK